MDECESQIAAYLSFIKTYYLMIYVRFTIIFTKNFTIVLEKSLFTKNLTNSFTIDII